MEWGVKGVKNGQGYSSFICLIHSFVHKLELRAKIVVSIYSNKKNLNSKLTNLANMNNIWPFQMMYNVKWGREGYNKLRLFFLFISIEIIFLNTI